MVYELITLWDILLTPLVCFILTRIAIATRNKRYKKEDPLYRYYLPGLYMKFGGAIFITLVYHFYYKVGDTYGYLQHIQIINSSFGESFGIWWKLVLNLSTDLDPKMYPYASEMFWYDKPATYIVASIGALFGVFTGSNYMPTAMIFAYASFTGSWAMYKTFANIYPKLHKQLAIAFLFLPSLAIWGSAIFKDTICIFALGWLTYTTFRIFVHKDFSIKNLFMFALSIYLISVIKVYILLAFAPALTLWLLLNYTKKIKSAVAKVALKTSFFALIIFGFAFVSAKFSDSLQQYSLENLATTSTVTRTNLKSTSIDEGGTFYDLGEVSPSLGGMLAKFPAAVNVTLFRPYVWEARKIFVFLSGVEALLFLYFTLFVFYKVGLKRSLRTINQDPNILFCLVFTLIFAFAVGISTYNFGALSRYKIPCLPFYVAFLMILYSYRVRPDTADDTSQSDVLTPPVLENDKGPDRRGRVTRTV